MSYRISKLLKAVDIYDYLKIIKDRFYLNRAEKELIQKRYNFYSELINEGNICFDIGANYGNRTEIFLELGAKVVAVEPQPQQAKFLRRKFKNKINVVEKAVGSSAGKSIMYVSYDNPLSSLSSDWITQVKEKRFKGVKWDKNIKVEITTLDYLIKLYGKPDFCKIDVEGYEFEVLKGLSEPIKNISFEFTIPEFTNKAIDCINYLESLGTIICNYSQGEKLQFGLNEWLEPSKFIQLLKNFSSKKINDGDIYVKYQDI